MDLTKKNNDLKIDEKFEPDMKKWITLNPPVTKNKKPDTSLLINKIKININVIIMYPESTKPQVNLNKPKVAKSASSKMLNKSTIESVSKLAKSSLLDDELETSELPEDILICATMDRGSIFKKSVSNLNKKPLISKTDRNFHKPSDNHIDNDSFDDIQSPITIKFSSMPKSETLNLHDKENFSKIEKKMKIVKQETNIKPEKRTQSELQKKKKVDFDETFENSMAENSKFKKTKIEPTNKMKEIKHSAIKERIKELKNELAAEDEYRDDSFDEKFLGDYDINKNTEDDEELKNLEEALNDFQMYYNENLFRALPTDDFYLNFELKMLKEKYSEFQEIYYSKLNEFILAHTKLKSYSLKYYDKFRSMKKKVIEIRDKIETHDYLSDLRDLTVVRENNAISNILSTVRHETQMLKFLLNLKIDKTEMEKTVKIRKAQNEEKKKKLLSISEKIFSKGKNFALCGLNQKFMLKKIFEKNNLKFEEPAEPLPEEENNENKDNKENKEENNFHDSLNDVLPTVNTYEQQIDEDEPQDELTLSLQKYVDDFYSKKKIPKIKFKKYPDGSYIFGTQIVHVSIEEDNIISKMKYNFYNLVKSGDNSMKLETFLDFYSMLEGKKVKEIEKEKEIKKKDSGPAVIKKSNFLSIL